MSLLLISNFLGIDAFSQHARAIEKAEVNKVILKMFYELGKFRGFLIFYDKEGNQSAVNLPHQNAKTVPDIILTISHS
ncbi:MAG: hypothetical protein V1858_04545 [Candidatus Gottesmanbacteria bacterium]